MMDDSTSGQNSRVRTSDCFQVVGLFSSSFLIMILRQWSYLLLISLTKFLSCILNGQCKCIIAVIFLNSHRSPVQ